MTSMVKKVKRLSHLDKELMKLLFSPETQMLNSKSLSKTLGIPATTVQRHRKRLEGTLLTRTYGVDLKKLGWNRVYFFVGIKGGRTAAVAKELSKLIEVVSVKKSIGHPTIDLHVEAVVKDNADILRIIEMIWRINGIEDVIWSVELQDLSRKSSVPPHIVNMF